MRVMRRKSNGNLLDPGINSLQYNQETVGHYGELDTQTCTSLRVPTTPTMVSSIITIIIVEIYKETSWNVNDINSIAFGKPQHCPVDIPEMAFLAIIQTQQFPHIILYSQGNFGIAFNQKRIQLQI